MLEEMHDQVLSLPIFVKVKSGQSHLFCHLKNIFLYVQMCVVTSATGTM